MASSPPLAGIGHTNKSGTLETNILHDDWRKVTEAEYTSAHHYTQRILEDFYDNRAQVEALLVEAKRLEPADPEAARGEAPQ